MRKLLLDNWIELLLALLVTAQFLIQVDIIPQQKMVIWFVSILTIFFMLFKNNKDNHAFQKVTDGFLESGKNERKRTNQVIRQMISNNKLAEIKMTGLEEQNSLVTRLIKEGLITEKSVYRIIQKYKFYSLFCYQNVPSQEAVQKILGNTFRNPTLEAVESIGFIKVGTRHNLYILPHDFLSPRLRNPFTLERAIRRQVFNYWKSFLELLRKKDAPFTKKYLRSNPDPTNCTYMLSVSNFHDVIINYIGYNAFSTKFKNLLQAQVDINQLKKEVSKRRYDVKKFIVSISYELFLSDIPEKDRAVFIGKEESLKQKLSVKKFVDYKDKREELTNELRKHFSQRKASQYARTISSKSEKYFDLFAALGIDIS